MRIRTAAASAIIGAGLVASLVAAPAVGAQHKSAGAADWMADVYDGARTTTLIDMIIPGTHDSGSDAIKDRAPCAIEPIAGISSVFTLAAEQNPCTAAALARAQKQSLAGQLRGGVRYLDIRIGVPASKVIDAPRPPAKNPAKVPLVLHHNYVSVPLASGLRDVARFVANHPKEQVIFDIQHVDLTDNPAINDYYYNALKRVLRSERPANGLAPLCRSAWTRDQVPVKDTRLGTRVTIGKAWKAGRSILLVADPTELSPDNCIRNRDQVLHSPWPNTDIVAVSKQANLSYLQERKRRISSGDCVDEAGANWCGLFVSQLQLTPSTVNYANCVFNKVGDKCSLKALAGEVNNRIPGYLRTWTRQGLPTNMFIMDYYEASDPSAVAAAIALNRAAVKTPVTPGRG